VQTTAADWLTAIGTVSAAVIALVLALVPLGFRRRNRPRLRVSVGELEPFTRIEPNPAQPEATVVRIMVENVGKTEARRLRIHLQQCWVLSPPPKAAGGPWEAVDIDPLPLRWASRPNRDHGDGAAETTLPAGMRDFVPVTRERWQDRKLFLLGVEGVVEIAPYYDFGEYRFELVISGENLKPETHVLRVMKTAENRLPWPALVEAPAPEETFNGGYIALVDAANRQAKAEEGEESPSGTRLS
jgi:hypothetical protein